MSLMLFISLNYTLRQSANDPQLQIAQDIVTGLVGGQPVLSLLPEQKIDIAQSLDSFTMVFDQNGILIASSALLNRKPPVFPASDLQTARSDGQDLFTWEPEPGLRYAVVAISYSGSEQSGYVVVGRSLSETTQRLNTLAVFVFIGWFLTLFIDFVLIVFLKRITLPKTERRIAKNVKSKSKKRVRR